MDPLATAAEIVAILQTAETVPSVGHRRASRAERLEAYLAYQRETYKFMAGVNHLSFLGQLKTFTWRTTGTVWIPMIGPFVDFVLPDDLSARPFIAHV
jgi:hypothetical protein